MSSDGELLRIHSDDLPHGLTVHPVTRSRKDGFYADQHADVQPIELSTAPASAVIAQLEPPKGRLGFNRFDFKRKLR